MKTIQMSFVRVISVVLLVVVALLQSDGHGDNERKIAAVTHKKHYGVYHQFNHESKHPFINKISEQARDGNAFRASQIISALPVDGDPDSIIENNIGRNVIRMRTGNLGYLSLKTPQWFRPISLSPSMKDYGNFLGSIIVLTSNMILIDSKVADQAISGSLVKYNRYKLYTMHHRDDEIEDRWLYYKFKPGHPLHLLELELIEILDSGFCLFKLTDPYVRFPDRWLIRWKVNYSRHGLRRLGYPEDQFRRPDLGCFGFMYTDALLDYKGVVVNTEYPVSIFYYDEGERTIAYANDGRFNYKPYSNLNRTYNSGSPVFCGPEGKLRFFARKFNETALQLIPIHEIANDVKLVAGFTYDKFVTTFGRRDRGKNEPGWEPFGLPPWWFRQVYRNKATRIRNRTSWYAGSMMVVSQGYFMIPETVSNEALHESFLEWTHFNTPRFPTMRVHSFGEPPRVRRDFRSFYPKFDRALGYSGMYLWNRRTNDPGWRDEGLPKIEFGRDHTDSNCNYLLNLMIGDKSKPDIRWAVRTPAFVIPNSCSKKYCYIKIIGDHRPELFEPFNPVMCEGYPAFIMMNSRARHRDGGRLALKIEYILIYLRRAHPSLHQSLVKNPDYNVYNLEYFERQLIYPSRTPSWYRIMLNHSPQRGRLFNYAGPLVILSKNKFVASNYVINNALHLNQYTRSHFRLLDLPEDNSTSWIYGDGTTRAPLEWDGLPMELNQDYLIAQASYFPELDHHIENVNMVVMTSERGFGDVELPTLEDFDPKNQSLSSLEDCYAYTYTYDGRKKKLVFTGVPLQIYRCDDIYCYGSQHPFDSRHDLGSGTQAGAPVLCGSNLMFFNAPILDHLNYAEFRIIRQAVIGKMLEDDKIMKDLEPPNWYRLLLFEEMPSPLFQPIYFLPQMIVLSQTYFLGVEKDVDTAVELSNRDNISWTLLRNNEHPTPSGFFELNQKTLDTKDDVPSKVLILPDTGLAIYRRNTKYEMVKGISQNLLGQVKRGEELKDDCWVYIYKREPSWVTNETFRFYSVKVSIKYCENGFCDTRPHRGWFQGGAPIVCKGVLSYIYHQREDESIPRAVQISWIYAKVREWLMSINSPTDVPANPPTNEVTAFEKITQFFQKLLNQAVTHPVITPILVERQE